MAREHGATDVLLMTGAWLEDWYPRTIGRLDRMGITPVQLETLSDCDRPEDLTRWPELGT